MDSWRDPSFRDRLYDNALNGVRYYLGKPIPFVPELAARMGSDDRDVSAGAWAEAEERFIRHTA